MISKTGGFFVYIYAFTMRFATRSGIQSSAKYIFQHIYKYGFKKWSKFSTKTFMKEFAIGFISGAISGAAGIYMDKNKIEQIGQIAFDISYRAKEYVLTSLAKGEKINFKGLIKALLPAVTKKLSFLDWL
jgi:hypothetical protein